MIAEDALEETDVGEAGNVVEDEGLVGDMLAIISAGFAFFAPEIGIVPLSGRPPTIRMRSISLSPAAPARPQLPDDDRFPHGRNRSLVQVIADGPVRDPSSSHGRIAAKVRTTARCGSVPSDSRVGACLIGEPVSTSPGHAYGSSSFPVARAPAPAVRPAPHPRPGRAPAPCGA